jgi:hypothetical protein
VTGIYIIQRLGVWLWRLWFFGDGCVLGLVWGFCLYGLFIWFVYSVWWLCG